jgi:hypothetical protein
MSLLQMNDKASRTEDATFGGEDYAKGSGYILWTSIAAFIVVTIAVTFFLMANRKPPVAAGEITQVWIHPVHTISHPKDAAGVEYSPEAFDQVLVFASVRIRNQSKQPIAFQQMLTNVTLADGVHSSYAASPIDYDRIFIAYPELSGLKSTTLAKNSVIQPGEVLAGMIVSAFHVTKDEWAARKNMSFTAQFNFHDDLILQPPAQITEQ